MAGELAADAAEALQILERHSVEAVVGAQGVDAILRVAGVVDEVVSFVPGTSWRGEHEAVDGRHDFRKGRRATPMASGAAVDRMHIHERDQRARGPWVRE